jgi:hypothetical protein
MRFQFDAREALPLFLAVEIAPDDGRFEPVLPRAAAEELGALIAHELNRIAPGLSQSGLALIGALYEPDELLRPGLPWAQWLNDQYRLSGADDAPQLLFFGALDGRMPARLLEPARGRAHSVLKLLPLIARGAEAVIGALAATLEETLPQTGVAGPAVLGHLSGWCGQRFVHGTYLTLLDLLALQRAQLDATGLPALADLLEIVFLSPTRAETVRQDPHIEWTWTGRAAECRFLTERELRASHPDAPWLDYLRTQRQISAGLNAFGIPFEFLDDRAAAIDFACDQQPTEATDRGLRALNDATLGWIGLDGVRGGIAYRYWPLKADVRAQIEDDFARR